ncbi:hypothetical protein FA13DRAFT_1777258 [Coprinellus micaceus]|uniref:Uncharacterized protein n=1 Tax=Coprinellus micaceus TaxID=71717 RepID=A0A4Y7SW43_COPMI|nr:hypothetical protein FA13DRAFT_1777258 [Coprinellus micaceus]
MGNDLRYPGESPPCYSDGRQHVRSQITANSVSPPAGELGYPCFIPSDASEQRSKDEASQIGNDIRSYLRLTATISSSNFTRLGPLAGIQNSCMTTVLLIVALIVFFIEYGRQKGRIIQVIRRDAGLCYLTVTGTHGFLLQYGTM